MSGSAICSADPVSAAADADDCAANCEMEVAMRSYILARSRYPETTRLTSSTRSPLSQMPLAEPMSLTRISPLTLLISACLPDIELSLTAMSHWSERPMVTDMDRIG